MTFNSHSKQITKLMPRCEKRQCGIYFTPFDIIQDIIDKIFLYKHSHTISTILEPSCGSCNFIKLLDKSFQNKHIYGIELNNYIFDSICNFNLKNNILKLIHDDFLNHKFQLKFDLIIGNPPYGRFFVPEQESNIVYGSCNMYIQFILKSLTLLQPNGILCFLLPSNFSRTFSYSNVRKYLYESYSILDIVEYSGRRFLNTSISTIALFIQKNNNRLQNDLYTVKYTLDNSILYILNNKLKTDILKKLKLFSHTTIHKLNCIIHSGNSSLVKGPLIFVRKCHSFDHLNKCIIDHTTHLKQSSVMVGKEYIYIQHSDINILKLIINSFKHTNTIKFFDSFFDTQSFTIRELKFVIPIFVPYHTLNNFKIKKQFGKICYYGTVRYMKYAKMPFIYKILYNDGNSETMSFDEIINFL